MKLGFALPQFDFSVPGERPLRWETVARWAQRAEALGFHSLWVPDHLFIDLAPFGGPPGPEGGYDALVTLGALARVTTRARLGPLVLCAPLRPPAVLAKALATVDVLSGGRLVVGLGAGWYRPELAAAGAAVSTPGARLARLAETLEVVKALLAGDSLRLDGSVDIEARCLPAPAQQPRPPVWLGGHGDRLLELAARSADGWNTAWAWTPDGYRERLGVLARACRRARRDPTTLTLTLGLHALVGSSPSDVAARYRRLQRQSPPGVLDGVSLGEWRRGRLVGTPREVSAQLDTWRELGVSELVVTSGAVPFTVGAEEDLEILADACRL